MAEGLTDSRLRWRRLARVGLGVLLLVVAAVAISLAWVGLDALRAKSSLESVGSSVSQLRASVASGDLANVDQTVAALQPKTREAVDATSGPHWWLAARLPGIGPSVGAVQEVALVVNDLAVGALPDLAKAAGVLDATVLAPKDGRIDVEPLAKVAPRVVAADEAVQKASIRLEAIDESRLVSQVAGPVATLKDTVAEIAPTTNAASRLVRLLPPMAGAQGPRHYLLLVQNNGELRATGGITGAWIELTADNGLITMGRYNSAPSFPKGSAIPLTREEEQLFTSRLGDFGANPTLTPDFPRVAEIARAMWTKSGGSEIDGVLSVDPVALQYVLQATGPVTLPSGERLTGTNAAQKLLNEIYVREPNPTAQNEYFAAAGAAVFKGLLSGGTNLKATVRAVTKSAAEGRLLVWSADPGEQALISGTPFSGELRGQVGAAPAIGVYLNSGSAS